MGLAAFGLLHLAAEFPGATDRWYSRGLFAYLARALSAFTRWAPVSVAECSLLLFVGLGARMLARDLRRVRSGACGVARWFAQRGLGLLGWIGVLYALFVGLWGLNHSRLPYAQHAGLESVAADAQELEALVLELVQECNRSAVAAERERAQGLAASSQLAERIDAAFASLGARVPALALGRRANLRRPWLSPVLSALGISGIYSPFTGEAHVNAEVPLASQAFTACHEEAHGRGFAREDEANFIAWQVIEAPGKWMAHGVG